MHLVYHVPHSRTAARRQRAANASDVGLGAFASASCVPVISYGARYGADRIEAITKYAAGQSGASAAASAVADPMIQSKSAPFELINRNVYKYTLNSATLVVIVVVVAVAFVFIKYAFQIRLAAVVSVVVVGAFKSSSDFSDFNDVLNVL